MFQRLGEFVARWWQYFLAGWLLVTVSLLLVAPSWSEVLEEGEFVFLPDDAPSRAGEEVLKQAFPHDLFTSSAIIVARRASRREGLIGEDNGTPPPAGMTTLTDFEFLDQILKPRLLNIAAQQPAGDSESSIAGIRLPSSRGFRDLLLSKDHHAALVIVELNYEFLDARNIATINKLNSLLDELKRTEQVPPGLELSLTGPATVGRDMLIASDETAASAEFWTILLAVVLLLLIYRAPILTLIPLLTVTIAAQLSQTLTGLLAEAEFVKLTSGLDIYIVVLTYGFGINFCLFLIARYRECLDQGATTEEAIPEALGKVGGAITAAAGMVMCGIGMMTFARFGKFQHAGLTLTFSLGVCLLVTLTLTPALLRAAGRWAFWPQILTENTVRRRGWISPAHPVQRLLLSLRQRFNWVKLGELLSQKPLKVLLVTLGIMLPFSLIGISYFGFLSYGLLRELPAETPSVIGAQSVQAHFPAGATGPTTILLNNSDLDFSTIGGARSIEQLTDAIRRKTDLGVVDVRSVSHPQGGEQSLSRMNAFERKVFWTPAVEHYVSTEGKWKGRMTRLDVIFDKDPFSRGSIRQLQQFEQEVDQLVAATTDKAIRPNVYLKLERLISPDLPLNENPVFCLSSQESCLVYAQTERIREKYRDKLKLELARLEGVQGIRELDESETELSPQEPIPFLELTAKPRCLFSNQLDGTEIARKNYELHLIGSTPSIRDLKTVTDRDQIRIDLMVLAGIFIILLLVLRRFAVSAYLLFTVLFSYLVTLGVTFTVFWLLDPSGFTGLDWKVPLFLFTILIAVGEDYNIFLMTRILEEQKTRGGIDGILVGLKKTGGIISSCGILLAGTFASLMTGTLVGMHQLGFALAFGVLLDAFVVRPLLVPAWLMVVNSGRMGGWGPFLGAYSQSPEKPRRKSKSERSVRHSP